MARIWLHRISHEWETSYALFDMGYLTLGWSLYADTNILDSARMNDKDLFECIYDQKRNEEKKSKARWDMWYFGSFDIGDIIIVPKFYGRFAICRVEEKAVCIGLLKDKFFTLEDKSGNRVVWNEKSGLLRRVSSETDVDLGFSIKVAIVDGASDIPRSSYADSKLTSRMKMRQTNGDISDLEKNIDRSLKAWNEKKPINFHANSLSLASDILLTNMQELLNENKFEELIVNYMKRIGADIVERTSKNDKNKRDNADADVIAFYSPLKIVILIQAKHYKGETSEWAVKQISDYTSQYKDPNSGLYKGNGDIDTYIPWVISSGTFNNQVKDYALANNVRLIDGKEFAEMLLEAGLSQINF